ncbi:hypothetical protein ACJD1G_003346, partial [Shigella flexneri]
WSFKLQYWFLLWLTGGWKKTISYKLSISYIFANACLCRMKSHDRLRIVFADARQSWRAFAYVMQVHENHYTKRAGVAGIRARAYYFDSTRVIIWMTIYLGECTCH